MSFSEVNLFGLEEHREHIEEKVTLRKYEGQLEQGYNLYEVLKRFEELLSYLKKTSCMLLSVSSL